MIEFSKPGIGYAEVWPMLLIFGVACAGVLVEAFAPRAGATSPRSCSAWPAWVPRFVGTVMIGLDLTEHDGGAARGSSIAEGAIAVDGPAVFMWGLSCCSRSAGCCCSPSGALEAGVSAFAGQAAALPGTEAERQASTRGLDHTEVFPLLMFAVGGMMLFPAASDLLTMFVALEVLSLPLYLLSGLARRRRLLSQEAALKYFLLGAFSSGFLIYGIALVYGYAGTMDYAGINEAISNDTGSRALLLIGMGMISVGLLFKIGAAPFQAWTPDVYQGAPTAVTAFMAAATKVAAFGALMRLYYVAFGSERWTWQPMLWVIAILTMVVGTLLAMAQTDIKRMLAYSSVAHTGFLLTGVLGVQSASDMADGQIGALQAVLFYLVTYGFMTLGAFAIVSMVRDASGEATHLSAVGGTRQGVADRGGRLRVLPAQHGRHPADRGLRRQVGGLRGGDVGRCLAGRRGRGAGQRRGGVLLRAGHRADVLLRPGRRRPVGDGAQRADRGRPSRWGSPRR